VKTPTMAEKTKAGFAAEALDQCSLWRWLLAIEDYAVFITSTA